MTGLETHAFLGTLRTSSVGQVLYKKSNCPILLIGLNNIHVDKTQDESPCGVARQQDDFEIYKMIILFTTKHRMMHSLRGSAALLSQELPPPDPFALLAVSMFYILRPKNMFTCSMAIERVLLPGHVP